MNLEDLRARKVELDGAVMQLASQWQIAQGQIGEINHWIAKMEKNEPSPCDFALDSQQPLPVE